jgi:hypothetical protein
MTNQVTGTFYLREAGSDNFQSQIEMGNQEKIIMVIGVLKVPVSFIADEQSVPISGVVKANGEVVLKMHMTMREDYRDKIGLRGYYYSGLKMGSLLLEPIWKV